MAKIHCWANFCPIKHYWELKQLPEFSNLPEFWWQSLGLIEQELVLLQKAGIEGLRLNIFNTELCPDGEHINWQPLDLFLDLAQKNNLEIHLCLGPYQYPLWPGIRLPKPLLDEKKFQKMVDNNKKWKQFGQSFLEEELKRYGRSKLIAGFYLGNEWHTTQRIEDHVPKSTIFSISEKHMQSLSRVCKKLTRKPIFFNTNWDVSQLKKIEHSFVAVFNILKNQAWIGFDIYPSQLVFTKAPRVLFRRKMYSFKQEVEYVKKKFTQRVLISEFEAQPWGNGKSWYEQMKQKPQLSKEQANKLEANFPKFADPKLFEFFTLWGAEFWLVAYHMGHTEMLDTLNTL